MNRRRVLAIIAAVLLTLFGTVVLIAYVSSAERRAQRGAELVGILVAAEEIPAGTSGASLAGSRSVTRREVPLASRAEDAVTDLAELGDQVTLERILAGEPIVARHFGDADASGRAGAQVEEGLEVVTIALEPQRALGGRLSQGDLVGVIVSLESETSSSDADIDEPESGDSDATTAMVLAGVPVVDVTGADPETGEAANMLMVTLQVDEPDAERIIFGAEFGRLWLTRQGEGEQTDGARRTRDNIFSGLGNS